MPFCLRTWALCGWLQVSTCQNCQISHFTDCSTQQEHDKLLSLARALLVNLCNAIRLLQIKEDGLCWMTQSWCRTESRNMQMLSSFWFFRTNFPHSLKILHREEQSVWFLDFTLYYSSLCYIQVSCLRIMSYWSMNPVSLLPAFCSPLDRNGKGAGSYKGGFCGEKPGLPYAGHRWFQPVSHQDKKQVIRKKRVRKKEQ